MTKKEKIQLLGDIATGKVSVKSLKPQPYHFWAQDYDNPELFNCEDRVINVKDTDKQHGLNFFLFYQNNFPFAPEALHLIGNEFPARPIPAAAHIMIREQSCYMVGNEKRFCKNDRDKNGWISIL